MADADLVHQKATDSWTLTRHGVSCVRVSQELCEPKSALCHRELEQLDENELMIHLERHGWVSLVWEKGKFAPLPLAVAEPTDSGTSQHRS